MTALPFRLQSITPKIAWLDYDTQAPLSEAFCRFQEHYEGPDHAGKIFTLQEYIDWYIKTNGGWTYYADWHGYNFPAKVLTPFKNGLFDPLSNAETELLRSLADLPYNGYVIGTYEGRAGSLKHEIAHALYETEPKYVTEVLKILGKVSLGPIFEGLASHNYSAVTWIDEAHAYLTECPFVLVDWGISPDVMDDYMDAIEQLQVVYNEWTPLEETQNLDPWIDNDETPPNKVINPL